MSVRDRLLLTSSADDLEGVYELRTLADCDALRERLQDGARIAVIGVYLPTSGFRTAYGTFARSQDVGGGVVRAAGGRRYAIQPRARWVLRYRSHAVA